MVEDGVVDATFHDEPIAQVLPSSPFFALSPPTYTKYELAYPCGNDANTGEVAAACRKLPTRGPCGKTRSTSASYGVAGTIRSSRSRKKLYGFMRLYRTGTSG